MGCLLWSLLHVEHCHGRHPILEFGPYADQQHHGWSGRGKACATRSRLRYASNLQTELDASMNINLFTPTPSDVDALGSPKYTPASGTVSCPNCSGDVARIETETGWQSCPFCRKRLQIRLWRTLRQNTSAAAAMSDQATCFFHPDKAFQACCQRCGRFVCAFATCSWERSTFAPHVSSAGAPIPVR